MLRNELEEIKREHPDGLNVQAGSCRFCGQMAQIETLFHGCRKTGRSGNRDVQVRRGAKLHTRKKRVEKAKRTIERQFGKYLPGTCGAFKTAVVW